MFEGDDAKKSKTTTQLRVVEGGGMDKNKALEAALAPSQA